MEEWPAAAVPALSGAQGRRPRFRPAPSAGLIHIEEDLTGSRILSGGSGGSGMIEAAEGAALAVFRIIAPAQQCFYSGQLLVFILVLRL